MKKITITFWAFLVALVLFFVQKYFSLTGHNGELWVMNATEFFGTEEIARAKLKYFVWHKLINYSAYILIVPISYVFLFKRLDKHQKWWLAFPIAILVSVLLGIALGYLDQAINSTYFISPRNGKISASSISLFEHLIIRNSIGFLNAFGISVLIFKIQKLETTWKNDTQRLNNSFWFISFLIYFTIIIGLFTYIFIGLGQVIMLIPQSLVAASFMTLSSAIFFSAFLNKGRISSTGIGNKFSQFLFPSLGLLGIVMLFIDDSLTFGDRWLNPDWIIALGITFFLTVIVAVVSVITFRLNLANARNSIRLQKNLKESESQLSFLKSQINPHFLFNSLNTVYGLALEEESPKSAEGVQKLSDMMRFMLQENTTDKIPLDREIKYIHDYIDFQLLRIDNKENIDLSIDIADGCNGQIAPMLLIPMIENAFKHGISMNASSWAKIKLTCDGNDVTLNVKNSMHPKTNRKEEESGIGLENVRKRLAILYPEKHLFQLFENEEQFEANIKVTLS
ncbi:histidine kinase [Roseivirga misakiensis]|uniref:Signal transduction histidine kinase internal region domain-containing protein n=1 Tax=Roseivirga misakiensis TaxID=1563681 RepID=A0A1E5T6W4_9BACT|nr:histidine kinase [Roseivirga misakiensis]OEK07122.1 hypothetical protein BFP71_05545 [Roseivirga misakiensis]